MAAAASMEVEEEKELPLVLLLRPLPVGFEEVFTRKFRFIKPWEEPSVPIHVFLASRSDSIRVLLCIPGDRIDSSILQFLPGLECIVAVSTGINNIDIDECRRRGIAVANAGTVFSVDVADFAVGLLLDVFRRISTSDRYVRRGLWSRQGDFQPLGFKIKGKRVGIVGLGSIGMEIARRLEAFGCQIAYNSRKKKSSIAYPYFSTVYDLAVNSDVIVLACALTAETYHIINKDILLALGNDGVIINIGRGPLIDESELVRCLVQGQIGGAGLDVFENEPHVPRELFAMDNVVLSPHCACATPEGISSLIELTVANLDAFFSNKPLLSLVEE